MKAGDITDIEGGYLSNLHLYDIRFSDENNLMVSSLTGSGFMLSLFRIKD